MRTLPQTMIDALASGEFTGTAKSVTRVTIQKINLGIYQGADRQVYSSLPFLTSASPAHELPNLKNVKWDRSVDGGIGSSTLELFNTAPLPPGVGPAADGSFDLLGFFTYNRGKTAYSQTTWGHSPNGWQDFLVPDRLIRIYQGCGVNYAAVPELDANLLLMGVYLIDDVVYTADGLITVTSRDVGRLLADEIMFPPVVPFAHYPLRFSSYRTVADPPVITTTSTTSGAGWHTPSYDTDSGVPYKGVNGTVYGHHGTDAFDNSDDTYWLSVGNGQPAQGFSFEFVQGTMAAQTVNAVRCRVWGGPYRCYLSVRVGSTWLGGATVPYDPNNPNSAPNGSDIPYLGVQTVAHEGTVSFIFAPKAGVTAIRVCFTDLYNSGLGPFPYRAGVRHLEYSGSATATTSTTTTSSHTEGNYGDYCMDTETEVLSRRGWLRWDQVEVGDEAFTMSPVTGLGEWDAVTDVFREHRKRTMISMEGASHSSLSTPDHRWLVKSASSPDLGFKTTATLDAHDQLPCFAVRGDAPIEAKYGDDFVEEAARYWVDQDSIGDKDVDDVAPNGVIAPDFLTALTLDQLQLFVETCVIAAGYRDGERWSLAIRDEGRLRSFEMACALAGIGTSTFACIAKPGTMITSLLDQRWVSPGLFTINQQDYDGVIWCPTLARNHTWLARRNGSVYFTGNSEIVKRLLAYGGFYWPQGGTQYLTDGHNQSFSFAAADPYIAPGRIWGDIQLSGTHGLVDLTADIWDKKPLLDGINYIKDILGFVFHVDEQGAAIFRSPNVFRLGNWVTGPGGLNASRTSAYVIVHDEQSLISLRSTLSSKNLREQVFIGNLSGKIGAVAQGRLPYPSGLRRVGGWCVDTETEIFTRRGWLRYDQVQVGDQTLSLDADTGLAQWQAIADVAIFQPEPRTMVQLQANNFTALTTGDHRWLTERYHATGQRWERQYVTSSNLTNMDRIPRAARRSDAPVDAKIDDATVESMVVTYKAPSMEFLSQLTQRQLELFIDLSIMAELLEELPAGPWLDAFLAACALAGMATSYQQDAGTVTLLQSDYQPVGRSGTRTTLETNEVVWCPTMGQHHNWLARRHGSVYYTGNTDQNFKTANECQIMADMITLRQLFTFRQDNFRIPANPAIQCDDQIQIVERTTGEAYFHHVTAITSDWSADTGEWTYDITTSWLGTDPVAEWAFKTTGFAQVTQDYLRAVGQH